MSSYFDLLDKIMGELTNNTFAIKAKRKLSPSKMLILFTRSMGTTEHVTLLCRSAIVIGGQYRFGRPDDTLYARSESGWVDLDETNLSQISRSGMPYHAPC